MTANYSSKLVYAYTLDTIIIFYAPGSLVTV